MKTNKNNFEKDYTKMMCKFAREMYGFEPAKIFKNKKKYTRKNFKISWD